MATNRRDISSEEAFMIIAKNKDGFKKQWESGMINPSEFTQCMYYVENGIPHIQMTYIKNKNKPHKELYVLDSREF